MNQLHKQFAVPSLIVMSLACSDTCSRKAKKEFHIARAFGWLESV